MKRFTLLAFLALLALALVACGGGGGGTTDPIAVEDAWARPPAMPGGNAAAYFTLRNNSDAADRLIAASSPIGTTEIHETMMAEDGTMSMAPVAGVDVPAGGEVAFAPGGLHVMFLGVTEPPAIGDTVPVTLTFENAGEITIDVPVREQ